MPLLLLGYGNPSRGDDALGPMLLEMLEADRRAGRAPDNFETLTDFQPVSYTHLRAHET